MAAWEPPASHLREPGVHAGPDTLRVSSSADSQPSFSQQLEFSCAVTFNIRRPSQLPGVRIRTRGEGAPPPHAEHPPPPPGPQVSARDNGVSAPHLTEMPGQAGVSCARDLSQPQDSSPRGASDRTQAPASTARAAQARGASCGHTTHQVRSGKRTCRAPLVSEPSGRAAEHTAAGLGGHGGGQFLSPSLLFPEVPAGIGTGWWQLCQPLRLPKRGGAAGAASSAAWMDSKWGGCPSPQAPGQEGMKAYAPGRWQWTPRGTAGPRSLHAG